MTITTAHSKSVSSKKAGFTLVEMLIAFTIGMVAIAIGTSSIIFLSRGMVGLVNYSDMNSTSRRALEIFSRDIRMGRSVQLAEVDHLIFRVNNKTGGVDEIEYIYDQGDNTLVRIVNSTAKSPLLIDIGELELRYYTLRSNQTNNPLEVKHVQLEVIMEKNALQITNTNHIISAQFMMRNKPVAN